MLVEGGVIAVAEGKHVCTPEAIEVFHENGIPPGLERPAMLRGGDLGSRDESEQLRMSWTCGRK